ncbi:MAG: zinc ABC transporter substrate-binding protein [Candidatus Thermoplasmatota archaeon]|nr:zinc ABC transporter substrate-binding protein [Candidatus Thermoplasmatota archaeon]
MKRNIKMIAVQLPLALVLISASIMIAGCLKDGSEDGLDTVIVTILPQAEMVRSILGENVNLIVMVPAGQSPHGYSPTPGQMKDVAKGDIYFKVGSGIEFEVTNLPTIIETNPRMKVVDLSEGMVLKSFDEHHGVHSNDDEHDHDEEDDHHEEEDGHDDHDHEGGADAHVWLSPKNMRIMAGNVYMAVIEADPDNEDIYKDNYEAYLQRLDDAISHIEDKLSPYQDREFLVYHPAWGYFGDDFELVQLAVESEGKKPGPQGVAAIIDQAKEHNISVVFVSPQFETSAANEIAQSIGGEVVPVDPLAENYIDNLKHIAEQMALGFA